MSETTSPVVVIGAGQAGLSFCAKLRSLGHEGPITLIGEEATAPYQRPPLSKAYALGEMDRDRLLLRPLEFYEKTGITLKTGVKATAIDRTAKTVALSDGTELAYGTLAIATGSVPRRLPEAIGGHLDGVLTIRDLEDADRFSALLKTAKSCAIIGGGYIGLEAAAVASKLGLHVTLIEAAERILQRVAASETSSYFRSLHDSHGVRILEGARLARLRSDNGKVTGVELEDGSTIDADFVITGIGVHPADTLARDAGLEIDNGIAVNSSGQTSDSSIYSFGDCASFPYQDGRIRLESVGNAIAQAEAAAASVMGTEAPYVAKPWFWSDQYDVKLQIAGLNTGYDKVVTRPTDEKCVSFWYFKGIRLIAVDSMNDPRAYMVGKRMIEGGKSPDPAQIADPAQDLKTLATVDTPA
ncbi:NAD(P)/FAD-dependent oxidoreductase [Roseibium suaedae]|uniref:3-phenylpropionate/trans-cinnamate dioxygenase ferredoxin reductase subunit n=1 Tax=Roseibium suaedae TaxID=735517 RepID=A0A1M7KY60_9HYPH|nr:FAD-dependent oxidoreductase [Roseibium suaedae]SHM70460.1 3-phenylpropionate/trans-cinnamate dioxygenase ferredoxin reductase subunit [Roseibium suaedae]